VTAMTVVPAIAMWVAVVVRLPGATRQDPQSKSFTVAGAFFATAAVLRVPDVASWVEQLSGDATAADTVKNALAILGATSLVGITSAAEDSGGAVLRRRYRRAGAAVLALVLIASLTPAADHGPDYVGPTAPWETLWLVTYWTIFFGAIAVSLVGVVTGVAREVMESSAILNTIALLMLGASCVTGTLWAIDQLALLALDRLHLDGSIPNELYKPLILLALGFAAFSAVAPVPQILATRWRQEWSPAAHRGAALQELWRAHVEATPSIDYEEGQSNEPATGYRLPIEVRDGILAVRPYITQAIRDEATAICRRRRVWFGLAQRHLIEAAIVLELARIRKLHGAAPGADNPLDIGEGQTIDDEKKILGKFALAWRRVIDHGPVQDSGSALVAQ